MKSFLKYLIPAFAIVIAAVFLMSPIQGGMQASPSVVASTNYQPNPSLNTNVTWSSFNSSMSWNEYLNATGQPGYINAEPSAFYSNYITINPSDIIAPKALQNNALGNLTNTWDSSLNAWTVAGATTNVTSTNTWANASGMGEIKLINDVTGTHRGAGGTMYYTINAPNYPSQNLEYDYVSTIFSVSTPTNSGAVGFMNLWNSSNVGGYRTPTITSGIYYFSENLAQLQKESDYIGTFNTTAGKGYSAYLRFNLQLDIPSGAPDGTYSITLNGLALTTYPIVFGANSTGNIVNSASTLQLSNFRPDISNVSIVNGGYTEALSQELSDLNYAQTQTPISSGNYIEQVGYQGTFSFPSAPDLSYTGANFTLPLSVSGSQYQALDVNGVSYLSAIANKTNGTVVLLSSLNPTSNVGYLGYVDFTASQWQTISSPPGFFSIAGIEYYWFIAIGAIASLIGLAAGVRSAHTKADQAEKLNKMGPRR
jgi:hypothetical protein